MEKIKNFAFDSVPQTRIMFAVTSPDDYSMQRHLLVEDWPEYGDMTIVEGSHCSCYEFDDTSWDAIKYTEDELKKLFAGWITSGYETERTIALAWLASGRSI